MGENRQRLEELLRRKRRASRVPDVVAAWNVFGVATSPLSADRQVELISRLRAATARGSKEQLPPLSYPPSGAVREFCGGCDMTIIVGWDVDEEPAVLVSSEALIRSVLHLREIYPDGLLLIDQPMAAALMIDFDDGEVIVHRHRLSPAG